MLRISRLTAIAAAMGASLIAFDAVAETYFEITDGELTRPTGFREWVFVGTPLTPNDMNNGKAPFPEFHAVYIDPESWDHWKETGEFRDGAIMIKELISVGSKQAASGNGYFMGEYIGLEATIKSSEHFPDEPGNWAYYSFSTPDHSSLKETAAAFPTAACNACHAAAAADDFVFTQYYPVLTAGKGAGDDAGGGTQSQLGNDG
ncbi:cytochrome P460 [Halomonas litopenaei]|uniref:Cytochrome P460 n=1 Tax=Halomonas litopenaei TaxID=2109328 RepID=A0ABX5IUW6_9GAMM|nr:MULTISPECIES: cytochrome P460 family protein [Halomonas]PTL88797.1 cytochrome P460 [Halomonas sp. SYSU XM8]PTL93494.1 cytochrome P460 [Halomonas litopenaei]